MNKPTLGDILRHVGRQLISTREAQSVSLQAIVIALNGNERPDEMDAQVDALRKKMTSSYISMTINRMAELQEACLSVKSRFYTDDDTGQIGVTLELKDGNATRTRRKVEADSGQFKKGLHSGLDVGISFVPDFIDYTPEQFEIAQKIVKQYRDHLAAFKERTQ